MKKYKIIILILLLSIKPVIGESKKLSILIESDGIYVGENINNNKNGIGIYMYNNKNYYLGEWKNNKRNGFGIFFINEKFTKEERSYKSQEGIWLDDKFIEEKSENIYSSPNKCVYGNCTNGFGYFLTDWGIPLIGSLKNNYLYGFGIRSDVDYTAYFIGVFSENKLDGEGVEINIKKNYI